MTVNTLPYEQQQPYRPATLRSPWSAAWQAYWSERRRRAEMVALARQPARIIEDMGFEPATVYALFANPHDELDRSLYRHFRIAPPS